MKKINYSFLILMSFFYITLVSCISPIDNKSPAVGEEKNANSYFWGNWVRFDNGILIYISQKNVQYEDTLYEIENCNKKLLVSSLGEFSKESTSVIKFGDVHLFRANGTNIPYSFTLVGFAGNNYTAESLGAGYKVNASCAEFPSYSESVESDSNGKVFLHSPISGVENLVTVIAQDGTKLTATLKPKFENEDLGSFPVAESGKYALKVTGNVEEHEYLYAEKDYNLKLTIENISEVIASNSLVEVSSNDSHLEIGTNSFNIASISKGMKKEFELKVKYKDVFKAPYVDVKIALKFTDAKTKNSWIDYVPLRFHGETWFNVKAYNTEENRDASLNGFVMYPDGNGKQFKIAHDSSEIISVPLFYRPYKVILGGAEIGNVLSESTEMKYSLGIATYSEIVNGTFTIDEMNFAEDNGGNDKETRAFELGYSESIKAYLHANDIDYYSLSFYNDQIPYTVRHFVEQKDSTYIIKETETLFGFVDGNTQAEPKYYAGYKAQAVEQKLIDNFEETVVDIKYDAIPSSIEIRKYPQKNQYYTGDEFDSLDIEVYAIFEWGEEEISDYVTDFDEVIRVAGSDKLVTVSYRGKYTYFNIDVIDGFLVKIEVTTYPNKTVYHRKEKFDSTGMVVSAEYSTGTVLILDNYKTDFDKVVQNVGNNKLVTVSYSGKTTQFSIDVEEYWYDSVEKISTEVINGVSYDIVTFGVWPQTAKTKDIVINKSEFITMGANTYYKGSDGEYYFEEQWDGKTYLVDYTYNEYGERVYERRFFSTGEPIEDENCWFKVEPIKWRVLTKDYNGSGKALLFAENVITRGIPFYESENDHRNGNSAFSYEDSQIRAFLNGISYCSENIEDENLYLNRGLLQTAFTSNAQSKIENYQIADNDLIIVNEAVQYGYAKDYKDYYNYSCDYSDYSCKSPDKIFLLSYDDVINIDYGFLSKENRVKEYTDFCLYKRAGNYSEKKSGYFCRTFVHISIPVIIGNKYYEKDFNTEHEHRSLLIWESGSLGSNYNGNDFPCVGIAPALLVNY